MRENMCIDKEENPLAEIISDGGYTAIFRTIGCIGDSLSSGEHESLDEEGNKGYHDYYEYSWGQFIARACGLKAYNFSVGGLTAKEFQRLARYMKCFTPEKACQAYIIALGVNDLKDVNFHYSGGFGTMPDFENKEDTLIGAYVRIIQQIKDLQPKARVFVVTPPVRNYDDVERMEREEKFADFLRSLPQYFEFLYVIDLRKYDQVYDKEFFAKYNLGGHMSAIGYKRMANVISTYIDWIIRNNYDDFKQVGFIGTKFHNCSEKW